MMEKIVSAFDAEMWQIRARKYSNLDWVNNEGPLQHFLEIVSLKGNENIIDVGTGSLAVAKAMSGHLNSDGKVLAFDISRDMLDLGVNGSSANIYPFVAVAENIPLSSGSADLVVARMVYHHLSEPIKAIKEGVRVLKPGGRIFIAEHVVLDEETRAFERVMFDAKEPGRHLWVTGEIEKLLAQAGLNNIQSHPGMIEQYSMTEWMVNSGLPESVQGKVLSYLKGAPMAVKEKLRINVDDNTGDINMDGYYACVVGQKPQ